MSGRRVPREIAAYLGPSRKPRGTVEEVVEQCGLAKLMGDAGLTDYDPLVVVMCLVTKEFLGLGRSLRRPGARRAWREVMRRIQDGEANLDHNESIPCRWCDHAFEPVIDEKLLTLFLAWYESGSVEDLLAIHCCPACGGTLAAKQTRKYGEDFHTPCPGSIENDEEWAELLLQHSPF